MTTQLTTRSGENIHLHHRAANPLTLWTSAPAPPSSSLLFAIGTSSGLFSIDPGRLSMSRFPTSPATRDSAIDDPLALSFLDSQPSVLASGHRSGHFHIHDLRTSRPAIRGNMRHSAAITHMQRVDPVRLVVNGLNSSLRMYDLRYLSPEPAPIQQSNYLDHDLWRATKPVLTYPELSPSEQTGLAFDVDIESGVIAATGSDMKVALFSLFGGQKIREIDGDRATAMRWVSDREGGMKSLYVAGEKGMRRFTW